MSSEERVRLSELLQCLCECAEKAARIAQTFRAGDSDIFGLLVEEKSQVERNKRFVQDFKTLADVLVQETVKRDVGIRFPSLLANIRGEEQNSFQNSAGDRIGVELTPSERDTSLLLARLLPEGARHFADALAADVHSHVPCEPQSDCEAAADARTLGVWIDPIDSTAEYIQGKYDESEEYGIKPYGLRCVCVLIGVYDIQSGRPIIGVVNQPFYKKLEQPNSWESNFYWAIHHETGVFTSENLRNRRGPAEKIAVLSSSETEALRSVIRTKYKVVHAAGAGYKSLLVACGRADLYVLSQATTYFWDTCGPHAILSSQGGGILRFDHTLSSVAASEDVGRKEIRYLSPDDDGGGTKPFQNSGGIISYRNPGDVLELLQLLRDSGYVQN